LRSRNMAREIRVLAEPDFPRTIFVEIQTNITSTGLTNLSRTPRNFFLFPLPIISAKQTGNNRPKRFWKGFGETFSSKRFPQEIRTPHIF
ncbi:MAG: hypothetical protein J6D10_10480, partial [Clostridia bacterium]|nr:hypothetical protein [Clostridia bacterium]